MKIVLDGRRAGRGNRGCYFKNKAFFTRKGSNKRFVLHEFYHHLIRGKELDVPSVTEERDARNYAREFLRSRYS